MPSRYQSRQQCVVRLLSVRNLHQLLLLRLLWLRQLQSRAVLEQLRAMDRCLVHRQLRLHRGHRFGFVRSVLGRSRGFAGACSALAHRFAGGRRQRASELVKRLRWFDGGNHRFCREQKYGETGIGSFSGRRRPRSRIYWMARRSARRAARLHGMGDAVEAGGPSRPARLRDLARCRSRATAMAICQPSSRRRHLESSRARTGGLSLGPATGRRGLDTRTGKNSLHADRSLPIRWNLVGSSLVWGIWCDQGDAAADCHFQFAAVVRSIIGDASTRNTAPTGRSARNAASNRDQLPSPLDGLSQSTTVNI